MAQQYGTGKTMSVSLAGPFGSVRSTVKLTDVTLPVSDWKGAVSPYSQVVDIENVSVNSQVNLYPSMEQIVEFYDNNLIFYAENDSGVITVYVVGDKPLVDYTIQAEIMEVTV